MRQRVRCNDCVWQWSGHDGKHRDGYCAYVFHHGTATYPLYHMMYVRNKYRYCDNFWHSKYKTFRPRGIRQIRKL